AVGGQLVLSKRRAEQDPAQLGKLIRSKSVTHTLLLPSLYQLILEFAEASDLASLQTVMVAGEACPSSLVERHFTALPETILVNEYGPTEGTVWSTAHRIVPEDATANVPIGRPVPGMGHYVLDRHHQLVPVGVAGELHLSGPQLASGYINRPELTQERFIEVELNGAKIRLYKTGDLVRYRKDGVLDFLGRGDAQVKIRGYRVELAGIANALDALAGVRESVVRVLEQDSGARLVGYFTPEEDEVTSEEVLTALRRQLPDYMVPSALVQLNVLPRLPNGKVDRKALPDPTTEAGTRGERPFAAPTNETEQTLARIWEEVLDHRPVSRHDDFFALGGDSLRSIRVIAGAKKAGLRLAPHLLFNHPTVAELAAALTPSVDLDPTKTEAASAYEAVVLLRKGTTDKPPLFCIHSGGGHVFFYRPLANYADGTRSIYALQPPGLLGEKDVQSSIPEMATDYLAAIRKIQPTGPYHLLGTCFSNAVALEMAHQLRAAGETVGALFIVDSGTGNFMRPHRELVGKNRLDTVRRMIQNGAWRKLKSTVRRRAILLYRKLISRVDEQRRNLYGTIGSLNHIYDTYEWRPYPGGIIFIRSSEFAAMPMKDHHVERWKMLTESVEVLVVEGHHTTLFRRPEAKGLVATIEACLA
ncbi:MAG: AMP-binding protein, partial [Bacteroidota bacterium]